MLWYNNTAISHTLAVKKVIRRNDDLTKIYWRFRSAGARDVTGTARVAIGATALDQYRPRLQLPIKALVTTAGGRVFRFCVGLGLGESVFSAGGCVGARSSGVGTMGASVGLLLESPTNHTRHGTSSGCWYMYMHAILYLVTSNILSIFRPADKLLCFYTI